ncbi:MAG: PrsW family intramembrane metalloprotease [Bacteroidales bacterium]|nr:PrsW family intramembrane metalloprotease [Bacteroidales bacterium]
MSLLLIALSLLPVVLLLVFVYRQDKYEKEPIGLLILAFLGGMIAIPADLTLVSIINLVFPSESVFYAAFIEAGFCEELCKFVILFLLIWWNRNFNEHMDGIVYAAFVGLGFACVENVLYVMQAALSDLGTGITTGVIRALLSVPGHFLFAVVMGYFLSLAKFSDKGTFGYLLMSLFAAALIHGLFDWLLMINDSINPILGLVLFGLFIWGDIRLWKLGVKLIRHHQERSPFKDQDPTDDYPPQQPPYYPGNDPEYKHIDWNAGNKY